MNPNISPRILENKPKTIVRLRSFSMIPVAKSTTLRRTSKTENTIKNDIAS